MIVWACAAMLISVACLLLYPRLVRDRSLGTQRRLFPVELGILAWTLGALAVADVGLYLDKETGVLPVTILFNLLIVGSIVPAVRFQHRKLFGGPVRCPVCNGPVVLDRDGRVAAHPMLSPLPIRFRCPGAGAPPAILPP